MQLFCKHNYNVIVDKTIIELTKHDKLLGDYKYYSTWHLQTLKCNKCNKILHKRTLLISDLQEENKEEIRDLRRRIEKIENLLE